MKTVKAKLLALITVAVLAIAFLSAAAFYGLAEGKFWLEEIGSNRMPSTESLLQMKLAVADARRIVMETAIWENDYAAQDRFADVLKRRKPLWETYAKEQHDYEPLPQTSDEELRWRQFLHEMDSYREEESTLVDIVEQMSRNGNVKQQQALFVKYYKSYETMRPLYRQATASLQALIDINAHEATQAVRNSDASAVRIRVTVALVVAAALLLVVLLGLYVLRSTLRQLGGDPLQAANLVRQIAYGDLRTSVQVSAGDRTSLMANVQVLIEAMERLANAADAIGKGDFSTEVALLSEHDRLGQAINEMSRMLRAGRAQEVRRTWLSDGYSQLSTALTGDLTTERLAELAIGLMGHYLDAGRGVFYVVRDATQQLELIGSYMYTERSSLGTRFAPGEGAIGQVARERKPIILTAMADDTAPIVTGTLRVLPRVTYTYPLLHEGQLLGVVELASLNPYDEQKQEFLATACTMLASYLYVAEQRARVRNLLVVTEAAEKEARTQSQQLQAINTQMEEQQQQLQQQSEELQQSNAQMEEQQQQLQQQSEELQQSNAQMEEQQQQLEQQNQELREARVLMDAKAQQLEQASQYKSEFLANMSHELRTPLNSIILLSKMMSSGEQSGDSAETTKWSQIIHRSGEDLLRLINDVLDLSKVEAGHMELQLKAVSSEDLTSEIQEVFGHIAADKGVELVLEDRLQAEFTTDRDKLGQILRNLLSNAFKFTKQGRVTFRLERRAGEDLPICLGVLDSGIGIPQDKQAQVFEAFKQADGSTSREYGGTGLGLTISLRFAQLLGGTIELHSTPGEGSEFAVRLPDRTPRARSPVAPSVAPTLAAVPDDREALTAQDAVILMIDDDPVLGHTLMAMNRKLGYKTLLAATGAEGLALARRYRPRGILLDLGLPDMDGTQVLHEIKTSRELTATPVYIVSARDRDEALLRRGAVGFLQKPVDEQKLADAESALLGAVNQATGSTILVFENGSITAGDVKRIVGERSGLVLAAAADAALPSLQKQHACRLAVIDLGEAAVQPGLDIAQQLRATDPGIALVFFGRRAPSGDDETRLRRYSDSVIVKTPQAERRLLENVERFLKEVPQERGTPGVTPPPLAGGKRLSGKHLLVVDDDPRNLFVMTAALERQGAQVSSAVNGKRALEFLALQRVDLVLMDIMMPELDGYQTMKAMRKTPALAKIPVVAITAKALAADRAKVMEAGADDYLSKPVDYELLITMAEKWCAGRRP